MELLCLHRNEEYTATHPFQKNTIEVFGELKQIEQNLSDTIHHFLFEIPRKQLLANISGSQTKWLNWIIVKYEDSQFVKK